jgi:asparagine synthase (glutamine-hydrolysing)
MFLSALFSVIVSLMQSRATSPVRTFSIGFTEQGYNEAEHARAIARHLGTDHTELYVTHQDAIDIVPKLPSIFTEPFADSSQIPTHLISVLARRHVTVALTGDAGDELFAGYNRYMVADRLWGRLSKVPPGIRRAVAAMLMSVSPARWDAIARFTPFSSWFTGVGDKVHKGAGVLGHDNLDDVYRGLVSHIDRPSDFIIDGVEPATKLDAPPFDGLALSGVERMMALDLVTYLADDILVKVDRASMAASLESRVPMLDHHVVEFAWSLPLAMKLRGGVTKWPLRSLLERYVPAQLFDRPKQGFGIPLHLWLRGPLRDWAETLLSEDRLKREGYFNSGPVRQLWDDHQAERRNNAHHLWNILMIQSWIETNR